MTVEQAQVVDGIYAHVTGNSTFNTALGGGAATAGRVWHGMAEDTETIPFAVMSTIDSVFADAMDKDGYEYRVQFTIYETVENGPRSVMAIMDKLRLRLHGQRFSVTGQKQMTAWEDTMRGPVREDDKWRIDADYIISGFES